PRRVDSFSDHAHAYAPSCVSPGMAPPPRYMSSHVSASSLNTSQSTSADPARIDPAPASPPAMRMSIVSSENSRRSSGRYGCQMSPLDTFAIIAPRLFHHVALLPVKKRLHLLLPFPLHPAAICLISIGGPGIGRQRRRLLVNSRRIIIGRVRG